MLMVLHYVQFDPVATIVTRKKTTYPKNAVSVCNVYNMDVHVVKQNKAYYKISVYSIIYVKYLLFILYLVNIHQ